MFEICHNEKTFIYDGKSKISIKGFSRSAYKTGFLVQPFNIYLDAGLHPSSKANLVLVSHTHYDHIASFYPIIDQSDNPKVMMPSQCQRALQMMLTTLSSINICSLKTTITYSKWQPCPCVPNNKYTTVINGKTIVVETFQLCHRTPCLGYGIYEERKKLKSEFSSLSGKEIALFKKNSDETKLFEIVLIPVVLFISDTNHTVLKNLPFNKFKIVIIECTFIEPQHLKEALDRYHIHFSQLEPYIKSNKETKFILTHFSQRYKDDFLRHKQQELIEVYPNIIFWI